VITKARIVHEDGRKGREDGKSIVRHLSSIFIPHKIKSSLSLQEYFVKVCNIFHLGHLPHLVDLLFSGLVMIAVKTGIDSNSFTVYCGFSFFLYSWEPETGLVGCERLVAGFWKHLCIANPYCCKVGTELKALPPWIS